jgi:hypothetical protein
MTNRYNAVVVTFDRDIREDDAEAIINAIQMLKGVLSVTPNVSDINMHVAESRVKRELTDRLYDVLNEKVST